MAGPGTGRERTGRFRREDWLELGLAQLVAHGRAGLTLERMCEAAGRTRGSFYHHFADHEAFVVALLGRWRERQTEAVVAAVESAGGERVGSLHEVASALDHALDVAVRRYAAAEPLARDAVAAVDEERLRYVTRLYVEDHGRTPESARRIAEIEYALFVGMQVLWPERDAAELASYKALVGALAEAV